MGCRGCISQYLHTQLADKVFPVNCPDPGCRERIDREDFEICGFTATEMQELDRIALRAAVESDQEWKSVELAEQRRADTNRSLSFSFSVSLPLSLFPPSPVFLIFLLVLLHLSCTACLAFFKVLPHSKLSEWSVLAPRPEPPFHVRGVSQVCSLIFRTLIPFLPLNLTL
jgi:hypothetical protein